MAALLDTEIGATRVLIYLENCASGSTASLKGGPLQFLFG